MSQSALTARQEWRKYWPMVLAANIGFGFYSVMQWLRSRFQTADLWVFDNTLCGLKEFRSYL